MRTRLLAAVSESKKLRRFVLLLLGHPALIAYYEEYGQARVALVTLIHPEPTGLDIGYSVPTYEQRKPGHPLPQRSGAVSVNPAFFRLAG